MKTYSILAASLLAALVFVLSPGVARAVEIASMDFTDPNNDGELDGDSDGTGWDADPRAHPWRADRDDSAILQEGLSYTSPDGVQVNTATSLQIKCAPGTTGPHCAGSLGTSAHPQHITGAGTFMMATRDLASTHAHDVVYLSNLMKFEAGVEHFGDFIGWNYGTGLGSAATVGIRANGEGPNDEDFFVRDKHPNYGWSPTQLVVGDTYFVVGRLSKTESGPDKPYTSQEIWVNPVHGLPGAAPPAADGISTFAPDRQTEISTISMFVANWDFEYNPDIGRFGPDEGLVGRLRIGTEWGDVVPPVPEPSSVILAVLGTVALAGYRRRS